MLRFLSSTRLTVALCLVLAAVGIAGSLLYNGNTAVADRGSANLFHSPIFLAPSFLLLANVAACVLTKLRAGAFAGLRAAAFLGLHAGLLLLAAGLLVDGRWSFVGTRYYRVGEPSSAHYDWRAGADRAFPFSVEVTGIEVRYHPMALQVGVVDPSGGKLGPFVVREGVSFDLPGGGLSVTPRAFDAKGEMLVFDAASGRETATGVRAGREGARVPGGYTVVPVAWRDPEVAEYVARVRFLRPGAPPEEREIRVNHPAAFGGVTFCLADTRVHTDGSRIVGLQMTREPGAPLFWAGSILFGASLLLDLYRRGGGKPASADPSDPRSPTASAVEAALSGPAVPALLLAALLSFGGAPAAAAPAPESAPAGPLAAGRSIGSDERWEGEVRILEPVTVEKGATLTILPGTTVLLSGEEGAEPGVPDGGIRVFGTLLVEGEPGRPVRFARLHPSKPWNELFLKEATGRIRHARVEGALWGLHIHDGDVSVERTTIRGNGGGVRMMGTGARFDRVTVRDNGIGFRFWKGGPRVTSSSIEGNGVGLFYRDGVGGGKIERSRIANRERDVKVGDWAAGDLDLSGNWWGAGRPKLLDFRPPGSKGAIRVTPALRRPPAGAGAE